MDETVTVFCVLGVGVAAGFGVGVRPASASAWQPALASASQPAGGVGLCVLAENTAADA